LDIRLEKSSLRSGCHVTLPGSKSETNRLLLLQAAFPQLLIENGSDSDDSAVMRSAIAQSSGTINVQHAGTAMRFLTAHFASQPGTEVLLTGSGRMQQRPIGILVEALRALGAEISYEKNDGFPPLRISGRRLAGGGITVDGSVSSQFLSALLLAAPQFENGLEMRLVGKPASRPYLMMTLELLARIGVQTGFENGLIRVGHAKSVAPQTIAVESDWSSASYFYSLAALSQTGTEIALFAFRKDSLQGDAALAAIYRSFGVETRFIGDGKIVLVKTKSGLPDTIGLNLCDTPDIAQTIAVTCLGLGISCRLSGLRTLRIKETDRLQAMKDEMEKFGAAVSISDAELQMQPPQRLNAGVRVSTYDDHRMAMAFAPLALKVPLVIADAEVVSKSYRGFWDGLARVGIDLDGDF
jgi:3-phosphoshikimate 1-carboxyvinyltransferase